MRRLGHPLFVVSWLPGSHEGDRKAHSSAGLVASVALQSLALLAGRRQSSAASPVGTSRASRDVAVQDGHTLCIVFLMR